MRIKPSSFQLAAVASGLALAVAGTLLSSQAAGIMLKLRGRAEDCPWSKSVTLVRDGERLGSLLRQARSSLSVQRTEPVLDIELISSPKRSFWVKRRGNGKTGRELIAYLLAEHEWMAASSHGRTVHGGDTVIDCGAHVGVFVSKALELGAKKVIAIEPEPVNVECLRRNFSREVAEGRVVIVPRGVWSTVGTMTLYVSATNSGMNSMVAKEQGGAVEVPVTTIDNLVAELALPRADFIKMDIEGAEREALAGARQTLVRFRPRLMLDTYHLPDDMRVLPAILRRAHPDYHAQCGPCDAYPDGHAIVPHVMFYE